MPKKKTTAKQPEKSAVASQAPQNDEEGVGSQFARFTVSPYMDDEHKRRKWELPAKDSDEAGPYIVELNTQHMDGLSGAENEFEALYQQVVGTPKKGRSRKKRATATPEPERKPMKIAKTYYRCEFTDHEWRTLVALDEQKPSSDRAIYRLWPDFPVKAQTSRSTVTIKADAALRSFDATGEGIAWAVIDSGVDVDHPHFGSDDADHALISRQVIGLHRCFADRYEDRNGIRVKRPPLPSPDWDTDMAVDERKKLIEEHRQWALKDDFGHGTHVAGIIAGRAPSSKQVRLLAHEHKIDPDGNKIGSSYAVEDPGKSQRLPRGVAPACKLVSLRVLDENGKGRTSQVIQALEYIREKINDNTKLMRVHGVNLSVGYEFDAEMFACGQSPLCTTVDRLVQEGVVVVAAAGNTGYGAVAANVGTTQVGLSNTINDPGNAAQAITVGATHPDSPHTFGVSYFSSKGPTGDGRLKPDLVAPGERITSCAAGKKLDDAIKGSGMTGNDKTACAYYVDDSGTSMAAPHVSGAVAAFLSIRREFIGRPSEVKRIFLESATPLGRERYFEGHGLVDLMRAIQSV